MTIFVLNPNTSTMVTEGISNALTSFRDIGPDLVCMTSAEGPIGIETDDHVKEAAMRLDGQIRGLIEPSAVVVACFSDPGVSKVAPMFSFPVVGIREAAITMALRTGNKFGVVAMGPASIPRHMAAFREMGVTDRLAGDRSVDLSMTEMLDSETALPRLVETSQKLRDMDGADVIVLGCAGMPSYKSEIEAATGLPVVEPCAAGVAIAIERLKTDHSTQAEPSNAQ